MRHLSTITMALLKRKRQRPVRHAPRHDSGFIMIEVLVGVAVLSIGILAVVGALRSSLLIEATSEHLVTASHLLENVLDSVAAATNSPEFSGASNDGVYTWELEFREFNRDLFLPIQKEKPMNHPAAAASPESATRLVEARIVVSWRQRGRTNHVRGSRLVRMPSTMAGAQP